MVVDTILAPYVSIGYQQVGLPVEGMEKVGDLKSLCSILAGESI